MAYWNSEVDVQHSAYGGENVFNSMDRGNDFTFVDFLPKLLDRGGFFTKKTYENFRILIQRANEFLRIHRKWKIVNCESVDFNLRSHRLDLSKMTSRYVEQDGETRYCLIGLRLWITERKDGNERAQQLGYFNIVPHQLKEAGIISGPKYETLDTVVERLNSMLQSHPLPGYIISIETQGMKCDNIRRFDADCADWAEYWTEWQRRERFIIVLRIFYTVMAGISEEIIGIKDFFPDRIGERRFLRKNMYESFSDIAHKVSIWRFQQYNVRVCNVQTLDMWSIKEGTVNTQKMNYSSTTKAHFVRVLRVAYTKPFENSYSIENPSRFRELFCRTFLPLQLTSGICTDAEYEDLAAIKKRISAWVKATGAHVLSAETKATEAYQIKRNHKIYKGSELSYANDNICSGLSWMFVIRLYLDGAYEEPPPEMLPLVPVIEDRNCCCVS